MSKRPPLTDEHLNAIAELRGDRGWSAARIAGHLQVSPGAVEWAFLRLGVEKPGAEDKPLPPVPTERAVYYRHGKPVVRFTTADDAELLRLEREGLTYAEIGRRMRPTRLPNTIQGRLLTLARREARAEAAKEEAA